MAWLSEHNPTKLRVRLIIPDPLQLLSLLSGCMFLFGLLGLVGWVAAMSSVTSHVPHKVEGLVTLLVLDGFLGFATVFGIGQVWCFDALFNRIEVLRAGIRVRTESMDGLHHLELREEDDGDGGAAQAWLVYTDRPAVPVNLVKTGPHKGLRDLVDAGNQFLASHPHRVGPAQ